MIHLVLDECERNRNQQIAQTSSQHSSLSGNENTAQCDTNVKKRKLFLYEEDERPVSSDTEATSTDELTAYLNDESRINSLSLRKTSSPSILANIVKQVFPVQASSAPVERVFSQSEIVMPPRKTSMGDELFQSLVFLRVNQNFLKILFKLRFL